MIVDNDDAAYGKRTDQRDLKLHCIYYFYYCYGRE